MKVRTVLVPLTMPLLLAACFGSSSSSGGSSWRNFTSFENINPNQRIQFQSGGGSVNYAADFGAPDPRLGDITNEDARLRVRFSEEVDDGDGGTEFFVDSVELSVNLPNGDRIVRQFDGDERDELGDGIVELTAFELDGDGEKVLVDGDPVVTDRLYVQDLENPEYEYMTFGLWELGLDTAERNIGGGAFGALTRVSGTDAMPTIGVATYDGELIGYQVQANSTTVYVADSTLEANFATPAVTFSSSGTRRLDDGAAAPNLNIAASTGTITGNTFGGNVSLEGTDCCSGEFGGAFFGPEAAEAGGWFEVTNINPAEGFEDNLNDRYFGSFGGARGEIAEP